MVEKEAANFQFVVHIAFKIIFNKRDGFYRIGTVDAEDELAIEMKSESGAH